MQLLDNQIGSNESDILSRISSARGEAEPVEPTEEAESLEVAPEEVEVEEEQSPEIELEAEGLEQDEPQSNESEEFYVDIRGREISFSQINEWEQGNLRQSDYTKKTQEIADKRKSLEAKEESFNAKSAQLDEKIAALEVYIEGFNETEVDGMSLDELRDVDPGQYLKVTEENKKRRKALKEAKESRSSISEEDRQAKATAELSKLMKNNPHWVKDGKETKEYQSDMNMVIGYLDGLGYDEATKRGILTAGHGQVFLDAAKYHSTNKTNASIAKKVRKAPVVTKPGGASKSQASIALEKAKANHSKYGTVDTALALRKAQKQFKGK